MGYTAATDTDAAELHGEKFDLPDGSIIEVESRMAGTTTLIRLNVETQRTWAGSIIKIEKQADENVCPKCQSRSFKYCISDMVVSKFCYTCTHQTFVKVNKLIEDQDTLEKLFLLNK